MLQVVLQRCFATQKRKKLVRGFDSNGGLVLPRLAHGGWAMSTQNEAPGTCQNHYKGLLFFFTVLLTVFF